MTDYCNSRWDGELFGDEGTASVRVLRYDVRNQVAYRKPSPDRATGGSATDKELRFKPPLTAVRAETFFDHYQGQPMPTAPLGSALRLVDAGPFRIRKNRGGLYVQCVCSCGATVYVHRGRWITGHQRPSSCRPCSQRAQNPTLASGAKLGCDHLGLWSPKGVSLASDGGDGADAKS